MTARTMISLALGLLALSTTALADPPGRSSDFEGIRIEVRGPADGRPVLMIPGLNSAAAVWDQTCDALIAADGVQCHIVNLPGFAGVPAVKGDEPFLDTQRDRLLRYVASNKLKSPIGMGHSLGGVTVLLMAIKDPKAFDQLVIVDSLPFFIAAGNPGATVQTAEPMAKAMREGMRSAPVEAYGRQLEAALVNLSNRADQMDTLKAWGHASDRNTTTQAMYEIFSRDLREDVAAIETPTLVLGAWASYKIYGATMESTRKIFTDQYAKLKDVRVELSDGGYHFLMLDDPEWLVKQVRSVL